MSGRIGAATYAHQPLVAIRSLRLVGVSSGVLASEGYSMSTALLRDVIFEPHTRESDRATGGDHGPCNSFLRDDPNASSSRNRETKIRE